MEFSEDQPDEVSTGEVSRGESEVKSEEIQVVEEEREEVRLESEELYSQVERIPWGAYIRSQAQKVVAFLFMLMILFVIISLSADIAPDRDELNPSGVIGLVNQTTVLLMVFSIILFSSVLIGFSKAVLIDHKEEFGITKWKSIRAVVTTLLTSSFIALVFILLDVALINVYITIPPVYAIWDLNLWFGKGTPYFEFIPEGTDRLSYSSIRSLIFSVLLLFIFLFPVIMFVVIFTRLGRNVIKERKEKNKQYYWKRLALFLVGIPFLELFFVLLYDSLNSSGIALGATLVIILMIVSGLIWVGSVIFLFINLIRILTFVTFTNFLLIFPFIFIFYLIPGVIWGIWDLTRIIFLDSTVNTIYAERSIFQASKDVSIYLGSDLSYNQILDLFVQTVWLNLGNAIRIIELDFIIIIGLGALVIGFAEGYSILAILRSITTGVSIARTGRVASRSSPKIIVISTRLIYMLAWLSVLWDKFLILIENIRVQFGIALPELNLPSVFSILYEINLNLNDLGGFLAVLTILIVPFYFIITSSFKFLSVGLVLERTEEDVATYILLISSAFILIITNILADISALEPFLIDHKAYLPLQSITTQDFIPFVSNIFDILESVAFYVGVGASLLFAIKSLIARYSNEEP